MFNHPEFIENINKCQLFNDLSDQALNDIFKSARIKTFQQNDMLFHQAKQALYVCLILDGNIKLVFFDEDGEEIVLRKIETNAIISLIPTLAAKPHPISAKAYQDGAAMLWHRRSFRRLMKEYPPFAANTLNLILEEFYSLKYQFTEQYRSNVENRIARNLLQAIQKDGTECDRFTETRLSISRKDIARGAHASLATVNPILNIWELMHTIRADKERITAIDRSILKDMVEGDPIF